MGGSMKGHSSSSSGVKRGKAYQVGVMLVLGFGAAIFGVMVLHKLTERRIFNLLLKQKDRDLISLQLLLQKERDYSKDVKKQSEDMKAKYYSLQTKKMELNGKILEMQSTISSLKDEVRTMELALEEKQKEYKLHPREEMASHNENQVVALTEILKQKEAEIDDLKHRLENPVNVWSVSTDDPSRSMAQQDKSEISGIKDKTGGLLESTSYRVGENTMRSADGNGDEENSSNNEDRRENRVGFVDRRENSQGDGGQGKKMGDSEDGEGFGVGEENKIANATHIINHGGEVSQTIDGTSDGEVMGAKEHEIAEIGRLEKLNFQDGEGRKVGVNIGLSVRSKHGFASKLMGKRWRTLSKNKGYKNGESSEKNEDVSIGSIQSTKDGMGSKAYKRLRDWQLEKLDRHRNHNMSLKVGDESGRESGKLDAHHKHQHSESLETRNDDQVEFEERAKGKESTKEVLEAIASNDVKLLKPQNPEDAKNVIFKVRNQQTEGEEVDVEDENSEKPLHSPDDVPKNRTVNGNAGAAGKQKTGEAKAEVINHIEQQTGVDSDSEEVKVADKYEEQEEDDSEITDTKEAETDLLRESRSESEEDRESYNEQTDEPEF
ncbi:uncharacterized protein LOC132310279 [Cornus florida]|uniref:uncharacterized protein LOC132310279 n=1 Tax=Cornus florida TaxID=4283 RepID=UPI0028A15579|nr:uncharacterized protein LOC132310279 [Cornus florida]